MNKRQVVYRSIDEIKPYEKNPRKNESAVTLVANSIKEFGFNVPLVIDQYGVIVAGHTRYKACIRLGIKEVPCLVVDDLTPDQVKAFRLADNKLSEMSSWNMELLDEELKDLFGKIDMNDFGFPVQVEDIDSGEMGELEISTELGEANNFVVLEFFTEQEWDDAIRILGLKMVETGDKNPRVRRHGIGRVIKGEDVLKRLEGKK